MSEQDTREKLEADARKLQGQIWQAGYEHRASDGEQHIIELLDRQAAITEREVEHDLMQAGRMAVEVERKRIADLEAQLDEVTRAYKERGRIIEELREQLRNDDEPFCETVQRWLSDDAPKECLECEEGCWRDMRELMARECDDCGPMHAAEREIRDLRDELNHMPKTAEECAECQDAHDRLMCSSGERIKELEAERDELLGRLMAMTALPDKQVIESLEKQRDELKEKYEKLLEYRTKVDCDCDCCNWQDERDRMQKVIETQAESFRKLEAAIAMPADCTECKHLDELRALRRRIRKLARFAGLLD